MNKFTSFWRFRRKVHLLSPVQKEGLIIYYVTSPNDFYKRLGLFNIPSHASHTCQNLLFLMRKWQRSNSPGKIVGEVG